MNWNRIKKLTLKLGITLLVLLPTHNLFSAQFKQDYFKTHLRWNLFVKKDQILISKQDKKMKIETLDLEVFDALTKQIERSQLDGQYFKRITQSKESFPTKPASIEVELKDETVEFFSFYKDNDKKYILDFWVNTDLITAKESAIQKSQSVLEPSKVTLAPNPDIKNTAINAPKNLPKLAKIENKKQDTSGTSLASTNTSTTAKAESFRDFRYGASFLWDYQPEIPAQEQVVNLESKTPDFFYPIEDRAFDKDDKEAHMQLTINLYNKGKWGLMNKSITLYNQKYGTDKNFEINEFIKANALLKNNIKEKNQSIANSALNILKNIFERSNNYELKSGIAKYLIQHNTLLDEHVQTLNMAKKLYVEAKTAFDNETALVAANIILYNLAKLNQVEQIDSFVSDASVKKLLPAQVALAYKSYIWLSLNKEADLIKAYEQAEKGLTKPVHQALLFNVAEAYFRNGNYLQAQKIFDEFIKEYSFNDKASHARLRLAVIFDLLAKQEDEVLALYKSAINRASNPEIRYEAKVRYVGLRVARKKQLDEMDKETIVFLDHNKDEEKSIHSDLKKLLWLTRLRTFINLKSYNEALTYLQSLPLESMKSTERKVFEADGAEVIYGLINEYYQKEDYAKAVKLWETYKDKYSNKVGLNPEINFSIAHAYIKLGLNNSYERTLENFRTLKGSELQTFPIWVTREQNVSVNNLLNELVILKYINASDWKLAESKVQELMSSGEKNPRYFYYQGIINFNLKKYKEASDSFEKLLVEQDGGKKLNPAELANVTSDYLESLYNLNANDKFKNVAKAVISDLNKLDSPLVKQSLERVNYLLIESMASESKVDNSELETLINDFNKSYQKSQYRGRVSYLYGTTLIKNNKLDEGEKILRELIKDRQIPGYIRELSQTELSALSLRRRSI